MRPLGRGASAYHWNRPAWADPKHASSLDESKQHAAIRFGRLCPIESQSLGTDFDEALKRAEQANRLFEQWRLGGEGDHARGSVRWLFQWFRRHPEFAAMRFKTRREYVSMMDALAELPMKMGSFGDRRAGAIDPEAADKLYRQRRPGRERAAAYEMAICRRIWALAARNASVTGVHQGANPFSAIRLRTKPVKGNRPTSRDEYDRYRLKAHEMGRPSMAAAAALAFECCQRAWDVFGFVDEDQSLDRGIKWRDYIPGISLRLVQSKTGVSLLLPLSHMVEHVGEDGKSVKELVQLYPELEEELARLPIIDDGLMVRDERTGQAYTTDYMQKLHRRIRAAAGLPDDMTFTGFRHGGLTELGDAGVDDVRSISGHLTLQVTAIYNKANKSKARRAAAQRRHYLAN